MALSPVARRSIWGAGSPGWPAASAPRCSQWCPAPSGGPESVCEEKAGPDPRPTWPCPMALVPYTRPDPAPPAVPACALLESPLPAALSRSHPLTPPLTPRPVALGIRASLAHLWARRLSRILLFQCVCVEARFVACLRPPSWCPWKGSHLNFKKSRVGQSCPPRLVVFVAVSLLEVVKVTSSGIFERLRCCSYSLVLNAVSFFFDLASAVRCVPLRPVGLSVIHSCSASHWVSGAHGLVHCNPGFTTVSSFVLAWPTFI